MKTQLIHCPEKPTGMVEGAWYVPLNLLSIATFLRLHGHEAEILDGQLIPTEEIAQRIDADIVGFDLMHSSVDSFDYLTRIAKNKGAITIVGGHLATHLASEILQENVFIDYVCRLGGEEAMLALCRGKLHPNLAYRQESCKEIYVPVWSDLTPIDLSAMPISDRFIPGVALEKHIQLFKADVERSTLQLPYSRATNTYFCRGCPYRIINQGCSFCSRSDRKLSRRLGEQVWNEANHLVENFGIECVVDFSDTFIPIMRPLTGYIQKHGRPWKYLRIYAAVNEIADPNVITQLQELGVATVLLGIESADEEVLRQNVASQKIHSQNRVLNVCRRLADAGIMVAPSYVLGMRGETNNSVQKTLELNHLIQGIGNTEITYSNVITPFPGSRAFEDLLGIPGMGCKFGGTYHLKTEEMEELYVKNFTSISWNLLRTSRVELAKDSLVYSFEFVPPKQ